MHIAFNKVSSPTSSTGYEDIRKAFEHAAPMMKQFQGFIGLELWTAEDGQMYAVSRWTSREAMEEYTNHPMFKKHHGHASDQQTKQPDVVVYYDAQTLI